MKLFTSILLFGFLFSVFPQSMRIESAIPNPVNISDWANDVTVSNFHPLGKMSGVQKSDGTLFVVVNDTMATSNLGIIVYTSTNSGASWTLYPTGISYRDQLENLKMVKSPQDSIYVFFNNYSVITCWNVLTGSLNQFTNYPAGYRDFDVVCSSTGSLYLLVDLLANKDIRVFGSSDGGYTWTYSLYISSTGAEVKGSMSATGDTLLINYYGVAIQPDTATSAIRSVRYRESTPGTLTIAGTFSTPIPSDGVLRKQFKSASGNGEAWLVYTSGGDGVRLVYGMKSLDGGTTFGLPEIISNSSGSDNYYFDIKCISDIGNGNSGFMLIYYSDSLQSGVPTNATDKILYCTAPYGGSFGTPVQISNTPPVFSDRMYIPQLLPMPYSNNDIGALWVGENASVRKLYWDRLLATVPVELTSFTASIHGKDVDLSWTTSTETNNNGFAVERNISGKWHQAGFVKGMGSSTLPQNYSYRDNVSNIDAGIIKYRLKQIDFDGSFEYSNIIETNSSAPLQYTLEQNYPNPFNPSTKINYTIAENSSVSLKIYDILGNQVSELVNKNQEQGSYVVDFNGSRLSSGVYLYVLKAGSTTLSKTMMLIK